jgi:hypothetical protein
MPSDDEVSLRIFVDPTLELRNLGVQRLDKFHPLLTL